MSAERKARGQTLVRVLARHTHAKRPPHPGQDRHQAQTIDDHQRQNVINTPRRARLAKITHRPLRLTLPQYLSSYAKIRVWSPGKSRQAQPDACR